jgi:GTP pyrophosphokinase
MNTALQTPEDQRLIKTKFDELLASCTKCSKEEMEIIRRAFNLANDAHMGVRRKSGEPYIIHPLEVALIVVREIGLGYKSISAALLHDVVEDTDYTVEDIRTRFRFGDKIASMVDGLTKIEGLFDKSQSKQAENFKKILLTLTDDVRVILIKLADRLHNMRTLDSMPPDKQFQIASETLYLFAPLAHRMGFFEIKSEMEDLSMKYYNPSSYSEIKAKIEKKEEESGKFINDFEQPIIEKLQKAKIEFQISSRFKSVYSTWRKMKTKNVPFEEIYDLFAVRIVFVPTRGVPERTQCWSIYSLITEIYHSKTDRIRDWVGTPKINSYEALHCTLMASGGTWVEIQIRTHRMDEIAERGIAAHWKYKESESEEGEFDKWLQEVKENISKPDVDALQFLDNFKFNLLTPNIYVFTPKGDQYTLPKGSTILDFAYGIHTEIGNRTAAAKVNYILCPLNYVLQSGDQIEIITVENQKPSREWLGYVITPKAKSIIKNALRSEVKEHRKQGRNIIEEKLKELGIKPSARTYRKLINAYNQSTKEEMFSNVGSGLLTLDNFDKIIRENSPQKIVQYWGMQLGLGGRRNMKSMRKEALKKKQSQEISRKIPYLIKETAEDEAPSFIIADCCKPIPGDEIIGFTDENKTSVTVHKRTCPTASSLAATQGDKIINTQWATHKMLSFLAILEIRGLDRIGILRELTDIIARQLNVNIRKLNIGSHDGIFEGSMELYVHDVEDLNILINHVKSIKGMDVVKRVEI